MSCQAGFTLVELMIAVAIVGVLATTSLFTVRKYIMNAKTTEARSVLGQLGKLAVAAYEREAGTVTALPLGTNGNYQRVLCRSASPVPATIDAVRNKRYQSSVADWQSGTHYDGWTCLRFYMTDAQYFQYRYIANDPTAPTTTFTAAATGDLDGDGVTSTFSLSGAVQAGYARVAPTLLEELPEE